MLVIAIELFITGAPDDPLALDRSATIFMMATTKIDCNSRRPTSESMTEASGRGSRKLQHLFDFNLIKNLALQLFYCVVNAHMFRMN